MFAIATICCLVIFFKTIIKDAFEIAEYKRKSAIWKLSSNERYIDYLEECCDTFMIYNYFLEVRRKLPENLHNIMLGKSLSNDDYFARLYIKSLNSDEIIPVENSHSSNKIIADASIFGTWYEITENFKT